MGCGGSKLDDLPLVKLCKERKDFIKAASDHRYALAAAHISYFRSLKDVGDALRKFVDEELVIGAGDTSPPDSPVLTLPSDEGKGKNNNNNKSSSSSTSISHSREGKVEEEEGSHLHLSSDSDSELDDSGHIRIHDSPEPEVPYYSNFTSFTAPPWNPPPPGANNSNYTSQPPWNPPPPPPGANNSNYTSYNTSQPPWNPPPPGANNLNYTSYNTAPPPWNPPPGADNSNYTSYSEPPWNPPGVNNTNYSSYNAPPWNPPGVNNSYTYYMKRSPTMPTVVYEDPRGFTANAQWQDPSYPSSSYPQYGDGGSYRGVSMGSPYPDPDYNRRQSPPAAAPPVPPSPPEVSPWDFLNIFNGYSEAGQDYYSRSRYGYGSTTSSPDSKEVREREGIPDLEDETEPEVIKEAHKGKKLREDVNRNSGEGTSRAMPSQYREGTSRAMPSQYKEGTSRAMPSEYREGTTRAVPSQYGDGTSRSVPLQNSEATSKSIPVQGSEGTYEAHTKEAKSSPDTIVSQSSEEYPRKKAVSFEVDEASTKDNESSKLSSLTTLSTHGTRDLQEVVKEIRDEFETASDHGKEVSMLLEVGKLPYQSKVTALKVIFSKVLYSIAPSMSSAHPPPGQAFQLASRTMKMAKSFYGEPGKDINVKPYYIAKTLDKLYVWEKRLYKEVKDEERLRVIYEKKCKRLKGLDYRGAESNKIEATQASTKQLLAKLKVNIRTIDVISREIHKLRDEELQPQLAELIQGLIRMWKSVLKCHQKQFQAIVESKTRTLRANTGFRRDSSLRATVELEMELLSWCTHFNSWIKTQKSYVKCLNGWLLRCLLHEPEETPDGVIPFSPSRIGAPQAFVMCNDWFQAMERISESAVADAMHDFALSLHELWVRQDDEQRQRIKAEYLLKDFEKQLTTFRIEKEKLKHDKDEKIAGSMVSSETGVSPLDDLKVDLDTMRKRLQEERGRHKEAVKLVHNAASSSIQSGLTPIFEALGNFASEALKVHEQVRINSTGGVIGDVKDDFRSQTNESDSVL